MDKGLQNQSVIFLHSSLKKIVGYNHKVWALTSPRLLPIFLLQPLCGQICCVLWVVVILKGETSLHWQHFGRGQWGFLKSLMVFCLSIFLFILTCATVPAAERHRHSRMLPPPCFRVGFLRRVSCVGFLPEVLRWGHIVWFYPHLTITPFSAWPQFSRCVLVKLSCDFFAILPYMSHLWNTCDIVVINSCICFQVDIDLWVWRDDLTKGGS